MGDLGGWGRVKGIRADRGAGNFAAADCGLRTAPRAFFMTATQRNTQQLEFRREKKRRSRAFGDSNGNRMGKAITIPHCGPHTWTTHATRLHYGGGDGLDARARRTAERPVRRRRLRPYCRRYRGSQVRGHDACRGCECALPGARAHARAPRLASLTRAPSVLVLPLPRDVHVPPPPRAMRAASESSPRAHARVVPSPRLASLTRAPSVLVLPLPRDVHTHTTQEVRVWCVCIPYPW